MRVWLANTPCMLVPMADEALLEKIQDLSDLELATLICLIAEEHCIIDTDPEILDELVQELELVTILSLYITNTR
jgi:hypothetical protein